LAEPTVPPALQRVVRTRQYEEWRNWFTEADIEVMRPLFQTCLDRDYPFAGWSLSVSRRLDPEHGSKYVARLINEHRAERDGPLLPEPA
jgi:hypothetical protein